MRLDKYLAKCGHGSRAITRKIIKARRVTYKGEVVTNLNLRVENEVEVDGVPAIYKEFVYLMLNKPKDVISASSDRHYKTVIDLLEGYDHFDLHPIGRLDLDTTGLLVLTNDGPLTYHIITPSKNKAKTYKCTLMNELKEEYIDKFLKGVEINDYLTKPAELEIIDKYNCLLTIYEGKYHQVKKMFKSVGNLITELHRVSVNGLKLDDSLLPGEYRELTEDELNTLKN